MDRDTIGPACLHQPEEGVFGLFTVVQGMGLVDESGKIPEVLMEISDFKVAFQKIYVVAQIVTDPSFA